MNGTGRSPSRGFGAGMGALIAALTTLLFVGTQAQLLQVLLQSPRARRDYRRRAVLDIAATPEAPVSEANSASAEAAPDEGEFDQEYLALIESICAPDVDQDDEDEVEAFAGARRGFWERFL